MKNRDKRVNPEYSMCQDRDGDYTLSSEGGLTLREHFAGLAMAALITNPELDLTGQQVVKLAVEAANDLLEALEKSE